MIGAPKHVEHSISLLPSNMDDLKVIDLGCGTGYWAYMIKIWLDYESYMIGIDKNPKWVKLAKKMNLYDSVLCVDVRDFVREAMDDSYDVAMFSHCIEHIPHEDGVEVLKHLKRITKNTIIVPYPEGNQLTPRKELKRRQNYDCHVSIWNERDFRNLGFNTRSFGYTSNAGRVVNWFERLWFAIRGVSLKGYSVAWWRRNSIRSE